MDLQIYLDNAVAASRAKTLGDSDQLTLGEMILKMEAICEKKKEDQPTVVFDFEYAFPVGIGSWRGAYVELALSFDLNGHGRESDKNPMKAEEFLKLLRDTVGKTFEGYKGGDFTMTKHTPVWVANNGNVGNTAVIEIIDHDYEIIIMTGYRNY